MYHGSGGNTMRTALGWQDWGSQTSVAFLQGLSINLLHKHHEKATCHHCRCPERH